MDEPQKFKVSVNVYDLSSGMAKTLSPIFVGKQIDGIWHTGIEVFGNEYYFGGGICSGPPKQTPYGHPVQQLEYEYTELTQELFESYLQDVSPMFTMETYDLFSNNCNNFTDTALQFLTGKALPDFIIGLPQDFLNSPMGQMVKPVIDQMQQGVMQQGQGNQMFPQQFEGISNEQSMFNSKGEKINNNNQNNESEIKVEESKKEEKQNEKPQRPKPITNNFIAEDQSEDNKNQKKEETKEQSVMPKSEEQKQQNISEFARKSGDNSLQKEGNKEQNDNSKFEEQKQKNSANFKSDIVELNGLEDFFCKISEEVTCVLFFFKQMSGPTKVMYNIFKDYQKEFSEIEFYIVNANNNADIAEQFNITQYPFFLTTQNGDFKDKWIGSNQAKLREKLEKIKKSIKK